jgi:hypothetical protein
LTTECAPTERAKHGNASASKNDAPPSGEERSAAVVFAKRLREGVVRGDITCTVRIWTKPHVTEGRRYRMGDGEIEIESITPIAFPDITPELARESGFLGVLDLLKVAKHGKGTNIYLIRFHYIPHRKQKALRKKIRGSS